MYNATNGSQLSAITFATRNFDTGDDSFGHLVERMRIDGDGRIGINVTKPLETLQVQGTLNASIGATGIRVTKDRNVIVRLE